MLYFSLDSPISTHSGDSVLQKKKMKRSVHSHMWRWTETGGPRWSL